jgi:tRNA threonylcarbamoyl adenosine modification protein YeaZ
VRVLAIDTASENFALALSENGEVVASLTGEGARDHSRLLLAAIHELLGGERRGIGGIAVVKGPGSYAGLRVGIATAQTLALALGVPVRGIATLEAVAAAGGGNETVTAIHPAGRGSFAARAFENGLEAGELRIVEPGELAGLALAGEGAGALGGREVSPEERCVAALQRLLERNAFAVGADADVDAIYLREPHITLPRRRPAGAAG